MSDILDRILARKAEEIAAAKSAKPLARMRDEARAAPPARDFTGALRAKIAGTKNPMAATTSRAALEPATRGSKRWIPLRRPPKISGEGLPVGT